MKALAVVRGHNRVVVGNREKGKGKKGDAPAGKGTILG